MNCSQCSNQVRDGLKFCPKCGNDLQKQMTLVQLCECGKENKPTAKFCYNCGAPWPPLAGVSQIEDPKSEVPPVVITGQCACGVINKLNAKFCFGCGKPIDHGLIPSSDSSSLSVTNATDLSAPNKTPAPVPEDLVHSVSRIQANIDSVKPCVPIERQITVVPYASAADSNFAVPTSASQERVALPPPPDFTQSSAKKSFIAPILIGAGTVSLVLLIIFVFKTQRSPHVETVVQSTSPVALQKNLPNLIPIPINSDWYLKGGEISGGFIPATAQVEWPEWMQALIGNKSGVSATELLKADFYKIPDNLLAHATQVLTQQGVFSPGLLQQVSAIAYAADTSSWQKARTDYQKAFLTKNQLPTSDPETSSRVLSQLVSAKEFAVARNAIQAGPFPSDAVLKASFLRMIDLQEGTLKPTPGIVQDAALPIEERFLALQNLSRNEVNPDLIGSFRGSNFFPSAVYLGISRDWISIADPLVQEATQVAPRASQESLGFLVSNSERISDLLWLKAAGQLSDGHPDLASATANSISTQYSASYYSGHAIFLEKALARSTPSSKPRLKIPSDLTCYNADQIESTPVPTVWPVPYDALAKQGRFDLILAQIDPRSQPQLFLQAAFNAGQIDLISRYLAIEKQCTPENLEFLYSCELAPLIAEIIKEEGLTGLVDPAFVLSVIKCESLFQPTASSNAGAFGLMQLLKPTFNRVMGKNADIRDSLTNLHAGLRYFKQIIKVAGLEGVPADVRYAYILAGYHAGEGRARTWRGTFEARLGDRTGPEETLLRIESVPIYSTRQYLTRVLGDYKVYSKILSRSKK